MLPDEFRPDFLEDMTYRRIRNLRLEPPSTKQVKRLVASAIHTYEQGFFEQTASGLSSRSKNRLDNLIYPDQPGDIENEEDEPSRYPIHDLKAGPGKATVPNLRKASARLERIKDIQINDALFTYLPIRFLKHYLLLT